MPIEIDIAHVARLARLRIESGDLAKLGDELGLILEHAARVQEIDTDGVRPTAHPLGIVNRFRDDTVAPSLARDRVLDAAPEATEDSFVVPPALDAS
jgi:aspartyl-tRNA(Asn)/glutamyl-tRNA(Gln) amidotransferase subunit C